MNIRDIRKDDYQQWLPLWQAYLMFYESEVPEGTSEITFSRFLDPNEPVWCLVAETDDHKLIGISQYLTHRTTWNEADTLYLNDLFVDPTSRRSGVGAELIRATADKAREKGASSMYWTTRENNYRARALYDKICGSYSGFIKYKLALA